MGIDVQGTVGPGNLGDGADRSLRLGKTGSLVVAQAHGRLNEAASRGVLFHASTGAAGVAPGTALGTAPPLAIWNPLNSGIRVSIVAVRLGYISGTLGGGSIVHAFNPSQVTAPSSGTALVPQCADLSTSVGVAKAYQGSTISATATILLPAFVLGAGLATTAELPKAPAVDVVDGAISIGPGSAWCLQGIAAGGSTPLVLLGVTYEEIPL